MSDIVERLDEIIDEFLIDDEPTALRLREVKAELASLRSIASLQNARISELDGECAASMAEIANLRSELERLRSLAEWKAIETAPKNGTLVDLWVKSETGDWRANNATFGEPHHSCGEYEGCCDSCPPPGKHWTSEVGHLIEADGDRVTHWKPALPPPPQPKE